ncbi:uncharacterized protein [Procambarus clarkii]|uniref:uncharacterized protein n=1 Tax=Procambarus clarkii TaxID=6728 RepID=UPI001E671340|nr:uncharacterized protein LOC123766959 [Procambarus clarkii]
MLTVMTVQLLVATVCIISLRLASASEVAVADTYTKDGEGSQQVSPWVLPQWWWLSSVLSLPQRPPSQGHAKNFNTEINLGIFNQAAVEDSAMPLEPPSEKVKYEESKDVHTTVSELNKRSRLCKSSGNNRCHRGVANMIPASEVKQSWKNDYLSVPEALVQFSQEHSEETVCKDLSVQLFRVDLSEDYLEPLWVRGTVHLGMCPSKLQTRHLGENVWPPNLVETKCLCQGETCSNLGGDFRCQAVRRPIRMWVRHLDQFIPTQEMVSVGCVCVQRISPGGNSANPSLQS